MDASSVMEDRLWSCLRLFLTKGLIGVIVGALIQNEDDRAFEVSRLP